MSGKRCDCQRGRVSGKATDRVFELKPVLDATAGNRLIWKKGGRGKNPDIVYLDFEYDLAKPPTVFADNRHLPFRRDPEKSDIQVDSVDLREQHTPVVMEGEVQAKLV